MITEDTGTQGAGNIELELGNAWTRSAGHHSFLFQPQLSYGVSPTIDLLVQPSWLTHSGDGTREQGFGDTNVDAKWRFFGSAPWTLGLRAGLAAPTGQDDLGSVHHVSPHAILVIAADFTPFSFDANIGYARSPGDLGHRGDILHASFAGLYAANERLQLVLDTSVDSNSDATQSDYLAVALVGVIYTVRPGLDLDLGYRARLNTAADPSQWLLGITCRGTP